MTTKTQTSIRTFRICINRWLWEPQFATARFDLVTWLFLRGLGLIYFSAFVSFAVQAAGLIGSHGISPLSDFIIAVKAHTGAERYWLLPMLFWLEDSDFFIRAVSWGGAALSLLVVTNILPRVSLFLLYVLYLSLIYAGQTFMSYQWDALLIETGALGLVLSIAVKPGIILLRWLLFRFMFLSGIVKIASGDIAWHDGSALFYHFQTQPLPTPLAWYAHHFPRDLLTAMTCSVLVIELILPFFIFFGRRARFVAAFGTLALQACISLTGNYNFFNLLVILLCLTLFDDAALRHALPQRLIRFLEKRSRIKVPRKFVYGTIGAVTLILSFATTIQFAEYFGGRLPAPLMAINTGIAPLRLTNTYGPFAVMTKQRNEIVVEGSDDGENWKEYAFIYKPGDVNRRPPWNIPHQPRLDWQLWFAALEKPDQNPWFFRFLRRVLEGSPEVTALLSSNPFPAHPPHYVRARFYEYRFSSLEEKSRGIWWDRRLIGDYVPAISLK